MAKLDHRELGFLFAPLEELGAFRSLKAALATCGTYGAYGLDDSQRAHVLAGLARDTGRPLLVLTATESAAQRMTEDLNALLGGAVHLPAREISFLRTAASSRDIAVRRLEALGKAVSGQLKAVVCAVDAAMYRLLPADQFRSCVLHVEEGMVLEPGDMIERLTQNGYERVQLVEARGQCALRGGILDVYPVGGVSALRLEFFDDEVDSIRQFDVMTQRSVTRVASAEIFPAAEIVLRPEQADAMADRLEALLAPEAQEQAEPVADRQRQLEQEFDLIPFEQFFALDDAGDEDALPDFDSLQAALPRQNSSADPEAKPVPDDVRRALPNRSAKEKYFYQAVDALRTGRGTDALNALMTVLLPESQRIEDYLEDPIVVLDQPERLRERADNHRLEFIEHFKTAQERGEALPVQENLLLSFDELAQGFRSHCVLTLNPFMRTSEDFKPQGIFKFEGRGATAYGGNVRELALDLKNWAEDGWRIALLSGGVARGQRLEKALENLNVYAAFSEDAPDELKPQEIVILPASLNRGFLYAENRLAVITESDVFGVNKQKSRAKAASGEKLAAFTDLNVGDYVVHENHGIGQYMGTVRLNSEGTFRDFLHIRYLGSDKLYVPVDQLDRVQKYIGSEGEIPRLNRLSGGEWQKQKAKVKASIRDIADDLIKLYAERQANNGYAFSPDTPWQREFEDAFPYEETPDQLTAIEDIKRDMESNRVMDRLLCGDVGYGKTEVALRAIFKCIMDNKQAVLLAPTTILVQQHFQTITSRFSGFPVRVEMLSRFKSATEQKRILKKLADGEVDIVIGTHRLLNKDVKFKDLGLLVVDEEQRFGVVHKEAIKKMKRSVDVLTLSATPIPRTLHMSMVGIRDMSILQTPPEERYPVQTYVVEYSDGLVRDAILRELQRGGQVYVLHNRVQTIEMMYTRLKKLVPEARIAVGHGQMREHALEDVMLDFYEGKFDVLLCTTIIEAGLDVPRANTLIVCDADRFGLSQLYQIRGRVGRSNRLAYAYLTVKPNKVLTENADKRLNAIREFTEFGAGFRVAMRDLEIRGTGNLLGSEQSGFMASVGYDLYVKMIDETVREMRGDVFKGDVETRMELNIDAYLPQDYVADDLMRLEMYKKIASINSQDAREDLIEELVDRFGDPNRPVMNLIEIAHMKGICSRIGIDMVTMRNGLLVMRFALSADLDVMAVLSAVKAHEDCLKLVGTNPPSLQFFDKKHKEPEQQLKAVVPVMEDVASRILEAMKKDS